MRQVFLWAKNSIGKFKRQKIAKSSLKRNFFNLRENFWTFDTKLDNYRIIGVQYNRKKGEFYAKQK